MQQASECAPHAIVSQLISRFSKPVMAELDAASMARSRASSAGVLAFGIAVAPLRMPFLSAATLQWTRHTLSLARMMTFSVLGVFVVVSVMSR